MVGILSDVGNLRKNNEDYVGYFEESNRRLYVIADGMGGHNAGEVASRMAVELIISYIKSISDLSDIESLLVDAIHLANKEIFKLATSKPEYNGMGTTVNACLIKDNLMVVANVGDSRCYEVHDGNIVKITKDHSLVQQLIDNGSITEEEALYHPNKNIITRALGTNIDVKVDIYKLSLSDVHKVIMCTDGLSNLVTSAEICDIVCKYDNENSCSELVRLSKQKGGNDNISVIVFEGGGK